MKPPQSTISVIDHSSGQLTLKRNILAECLDFFYTPIGKGLQ